MIVINFIYMLKETVQKKTKVEFILLIKMLQKIGPCSYRKIIEVTLEFPATYFEGEFVRFGETVYKANTNLIPVL